MRRWAFVTVGLYALYQFALVWLLAILAFGWDIGLGSHELLAQWFFWLWFVLMILTQCALLVVPVRVASKRPVTRRSLIWPLSAACLMLVFLVGGMLATGFEMLGHLTKAGGTTTQPVIDQPLISITVFSVICGFWLVWAFLFGFYTGNREPENVMARLVRFLLAGSILELLVAVPAHVYARSKDQCCGGFGTVWGLAAGASVMLVSFGPGIFLLFVRRVRSLSAKQE